MDSAWVRLKPKLTELRNDPAHPLRGYPDPRVDRDRSAPFRIHLAAWATREAAVLHAHFGAEVELVVGHLAYPDPVRPKWLEHTLTRRPDSADLVFLRASLIGELEVRSGYDAKSEVRIENPDDSALEIKTNGQLTAWVIEPQTGQVVGTYDGAQRLPLVVFTIAPGGEVNVPILVGTAAVDPRLGHAVPPGRWGLDAVVDTDRGRRQIPVLPFTITA